jgi:hypothetical protein
MPNDNRDLRADSTAPFPGWAMSTGDGQERLQAESGLWLSGGAILLAWTALALLLTTA